MKEERLEVAKMWKAINPNIWCEQGLERAANA